MSFQRMIVTGSAPMRKSALTASRRAVALVLERAKLDQLRARVLEALEPLHRLVEADRRAEDDVRLRPGLARHLLAP